MMSAKSLTDENTTEFQAWRQEWITKLLSALLILCVPAFLLSLYLAYEHSAGWGIFVLVIAFATLAVLRFWPRMAYHIQVMGVLGLLYGASVVVLFRTGLGGLGYILLLLVPFIAYSFLDLSAAISTLILSCLSLIVVGVLYWTGIFVVQVAVLVNTPAAWVGNMVAFLLASLIFLQSQHYLLPRLNASLLKNRNLAQSLELQREEIAQRLELERQRGDRVSQAVALGTHLIELQDRDAVAQSLVHNVAEMFEFYQVNLFIVDDRGEQLRLVAALPGKGEQLVRMRWQIPIVSDLLPGLVARTRSEKAIAAPATDTYLGEQFQFPETRAEVCFPLIFQDELLGVFDVHSARRVTSAPLKNVALFLETDLQLLRIIAQYTATALGVLQSLEAEELQLQKMRAMYMEQSMASWRDILASGEVVDATVGHIVKEKIQSLAEAALLTQESQMALVGEHYVLVLPLIAPYSETSIPLGYIAFSRAREKGNWDAPTLLLLKQAGERLALAFENTRLLTESRQQALYEEELGRFSELIWGNLKVDSIMECSVQELGRLLGASDVTLALPSRTEVAS
ncbi:MAG: GAF domain-containing protein [Anaerolineae bacterium]|nr:GAF domain-containing protein [Anaerolineae bacterium]